MKTSSLAVVAASLCGAAFGYSRPVAVTSVSGCGLVLHSATVSFNASVEDSALYMAWDESDRGDDINNWRRFRHVTVPAGAVAATIAPYEPVDVSASFVRFFFAPTNSAPYDATVEYVEATGEQYVDTGVYANGRTTAVRADFAFTSPGKYEDTIFGASDGNNISDPLCFHFNFRLNKAGEYSFNCKDISHNTGTGVANSSDRLVVTLDSPGRLCRIEDVALGTTPYSYTMPAEWPHAKTATRTMAIFANNGHDPADCLARGRLYRLDIYAAAISSGADPVGTYVPVVSDGVGYLWESVSRTLCETKGTGELVASSAMRDNATVAGAAAASDALNDLPAIPPAASVESHGPIGTTRTVEYSIADFGFGASQLKIELLYSRNADYSDPVCETIESAYSGPTPYAGSRTFTGLEQNVPYYGKLLVTVGSTVFETPFTFECPSTSDKFFWSPTSGNSWETPSNWLVDDSVPSTAPGEYDTAYLGGTGAKTIELARDRVVSNLWQNVLAAYGGKDGQSGCYTFNLNGHFLDVVNEYSFGRTLIQSAATTMLLTNGQVRVRGKTDIGGPSALDWKCAKLFLRGGDTFFHAKGQFSVGGYGDHCGVEVSDGAKLAIDGKLSIEAGGQRYHATQPYTGPSYFNVLGEGTEVRANGGMDLRNWAQLAVRDGAKMVLRGYNTTENTMINIIGSFRNYGELTVDNAMFDAGTNIFGLGVATHWKTSGTYQVGANARISIVSNGVMRLSGPDARLWVGYAFQEAICTNNVVRIADGGVLDMREATNDQGILIGSGKVPQTGPIPRCDNGLDVENGAVYARALTVGNTACRSNNWVRVAGRDAKIVLSGASDSLNLNYHTTLYIDLGEDGFSDVPIRCSGAVRATRSEDLDVPSEIVVDCRKFAKAHPKTSVTLIEAGVDSTDALEELRDNAVFIGAAGNPLNGGVLMVVNGRELVLSTLARAGMSIFVR